MEEQRNTPISPPYSSLYTKESMITITIIAVLVFIIIMYGIHKACEQDDKDRTARMDRQKKQ